MVQRLIIGISGASGFAYGCKALQLLRAVPQVETHLVVSKGAELTRASETAFSRDEVHALADVVHPIGNLAAGIASGSFRTAGMLVAPRQRNGRPCVSARARALYAAPKR